MSIPAQMLHHYMGLFLSSLWVEFLSYIVTTVSHQRNQQDIVSIFEVMQKYWLVSGKFVSCHIQAWLQAMKDLSIMDYVWIPGFFLFVKYSI